MNEPRVYKNSPFVFGLLFVMFAVLLVSLFFAAGDDDFSNVIVMIPFAFMFVFLFIFLVFKATAQTIISNDEISTKNLLGTKTLAWSEINRVSGRSYRIKLHNFDGDVTVEPSPQLPGYPEVIEWIGVKRPELFNPQEYSEMKKSWAGTILLSLFWLLFLAGLGIFVLTQANDVLMPFLVFVVFGVIFIGISLASPQVVSLQGDSIVISYLLNKKTIPAKEIASIDLSFTQTRNGKNYFVAIYLVNRQTIRISGLSPNLPVVCLVLKNWHKQNTSNSQNVSP